MTTPDPLTEFARLLAEAMNETLRTIAEALSKVMDAMMTEITSRANFEIISPPRAGGAATPAIRLFGVSVTCDMPTKCKYPETCKHVRIALRRREDVPVYRHIFENSGVIAPIIKTRIPLADFAWCYLIVYGERVANVWLPDANGTMAVPPLDEDTGVEDVKWWLVNYAAANYEKARHNQLPEIAGHTLCKACGKFIDTKVFDDNLLWVLYWANPAYQLCTPCSNAVTYNQYLSRTPQDDVNSVVW